MTPGGRRSGVGFFAGRLAGLLLDILLLSLFLAFGVALLDILVQSIVLVVGYAIEPDSAMRARGIPWDAKRHADDWKHLARAVGATLGLYGVFRAGLVARRWALRHFVDAGFESFVGKRYLLSREGGGLVGLGTTVSILGVGVGVMSLIVVISVMNGFDSTLVDRMMGVFAHVEVWPSPYSGRGELTTEDAARIMALAEKEKGVVGVAPMHRRQTFFQPKKGVASKREGAVLCGLDMEREPKVTLFGHDDIVRGQEPRTASGERLIKQFGSARPKDGEVVIGTELARKLGVRREDAIYALGEVVGTARGTTAKISALKVVGVFKSGLYDVDSNFAYTTIATLQRLTLTEGRVSAIHMRLEDPSRAPYLALELESKLGRDYYVRPWQEINPEFFKALYVEKVAMFIILLLVVLVASFNIIGTLVMTVVQKTREIGILKSMGAGRVSIMRIFLYHGFLIGVVGTSLGTVWGLWLCRFVENDIEKIFQLPSAIYGLDKLPVVVEVSSMLAMLLCSLAICVAASIIPAYRAARLNPVEALRYD